MGNSEDGKSIKTEISSPVTTDQTSVHLYPDWAAMQAYYVNQVPVSPYFNPAVASGHPHPYVWAPPQSMMPPYGTPYAAVYAHGGVYVHPAVSIASAPLSMESPAKPLGNSGQSFVQKLKESDGLAMSIGNGNADCAEGTANNGVSESSGDSEASSDGSDGNTTEAGQNGKKRSREGTPIIAGDGKGKSKNSPSITHEGNEAANKMACVTKPLVNVGANVTMALELGNPSAANVKTSPASSGQTCPGKPSEPWPQNERELKREKRKQSNRESARRSRLRKQAEAEELAVKVRALTAENVSLRSKMNQLTESSEKLKLENALLKGKLKNGCIQTEELDSMAKIDDTRRQPVHTADLLARVNNSSSSMLDEEEDEGTELYKKQNVGPKLYLTVMNDRPRTKPRNNAVAAR